MNLVKEIRAPVKSSRSKTVDPLTLAKQKVLAALTAQEKLITDYDYVPPVLMEGQPRPNAKKK